jgi:hypothetical protein
MRWRFLNMSDLTMTTAEAEQCITDIQNGLETAKKSVWKLWHLEGWRVLKRKDGTRYTSFNDCIEDRFQLSKSQVYRLKDQGQIEHELSEASGKDIELKDAHTRELKALPDINDKVDALNAARNIAEVTNSPLTARHIKAGVRQVAAKKRVKSTRHKVVQLAHEQGKLTVDEADKLVQALNAVSANAQLTIQELMTEYGVFKDAKLIPLLAKDIERETSNNPSRVFEWVKEGTVYDVPLKDATEKDYRDAKFQAAKLRQAEDEERKNRERLAKGLNRIDAVTVTIYRGDMEKTLHVLEDSLTDEDMVHLSELLTNLLAQKEAEKEGAYAV